MIKNVPGPELNDPIALNIMDPRPRYDVTFEIFVTNPIGDIKVQFVGFSRFPSMHLYPNIGPEQSVLHPYPSKMSPSSHSSGST